MKIYLEKSILMKSTHRKRKEVQRIIKASTLPKAHRENPEAPGQKEEDKTPCEQKISGCTNYCGKLLLAYFMRPHISYEAPWTLRHWGNLPPTPLLGLCLAASLTDIHIKKDSLYYLVDFALTYKCPIPGSPPHLQLLLQERKVTNGMGKSNWYWLSVCF